MYDIGVRSKGDIKTITVNAAVSTAEEVSAIINALTALSDSVFDEAITFRIDGDDVAGARASAEGPLLNVPLKQLGKPKAA